MGLSPEQSKVQAKRATELVDEENCRQKKARRATRVEGQGAQPLPDPKPSPTKSVAAACKLFAS